MTVHRIRTCPCGHAETFHAPNKGPCQYGKGHVMGGCTCLGFRSRRYADGNANANGADDAAVITLPAPSSANDPYRRVLVEVLRGLDAMRASLVRALDAPIERDSDVATFIEPKAKVPVPRRAEAAPASTTSRVANASDASANGGTKLKLGERKMLATLAAHHPQKLTRTQLGTLVGIRARGTTFTAYLSVLKCRQFVEVAGELIGLTSAGVAHTGPGKFRKMTRAEVAAVWMAKLKAGERKMLDAVLTERELTRDELGKIAVIDPRGTTFTAYLSTLRTNDLVVVTGNKVRLGTALAEAS